MKLPYGDKVNLQQIIHKLETYSLDSDHASGKHKAKLFNSKLGITIDNQETLVAALSKVATNSNDAQLTDSDEYGDRYVIIFELETDLGKSLILSAWIVRHGETYPRLTSTYPIRN